MTYRLMETSGSRIVSAQAHTSLIVLILIGMAIFLNAMIYFSPAEALLGLKKGCGRAGKT